MDAKIQSAFSLELSKRGIVHSFDAKSERYAINMGGGNMLVSLDNIERDIKHDGDVGRIVRFVESIVASSEASVDSLSVNQLYWSLETNSYNEKADFRVPLSDRVDRVLVHLSDDQRLITWVTPAMLEDWSIRLKDAEILAFGNLSRALTDAVVEHQDIDGVRLGFLKTTFPFKASLVLAPDLRETVEAKLGWPLLAVFPRRDFLFLWSAKHSAFAGRIGGVVVKEYTSGAYPISTEVYEINTEYFRAIGECPTRK